MRPPRLPVSIRNGLSLIIINGFAGQSLSAGQGIGRLVVARKEDENELVSTRTEPPRAPRVVLGRFPPLATMKLGAAHQAGLSNQPFEM